MNFETSLGCEVIAFLSDHRVLAIGAIATGMALQASADDLRQQLDLMAEDGSIKRHFVGDGWFYQLAK